MTKEEAIENLKLVRLNAGMTGAESFKEALDLAIVSLSQPSLPSNLDEAAEEYADCNSQRWFEDGDIYYDHSKIMDAFKSGAEWMAGQGITVDGTFHHSCGYPSVIELKTHLRDYEGADVIVQIRKK